MILCCNTDFNLINWIKNLYYKTFKPVTKTNVVSEDEVIMEEIIIDGSPTANNPRIRIFNPILIRE